MEIKIERMDHLGNGIGYLDGKITFVPKTVPGDIVEIKITKEKSHFLRGKVQRIITPSENRVEAFCPFYTNCGGCLLQNLSYADSLTYKKDKVEDLLSKVKDDLTYEMVANPKCQNYRNKITLKVKNGQIGYYAVASNDLVKITSCAITNPQINAVLPELSKLNIKDGEIVIRTNQKKECLIIINSKEKIRWEPLLDISTLKGIIINDALVWGQDYLTEKINDLTFKINYRSFFQVNPFVAALLFQKVTASVKPNSQVLDLYSGVGTLALSVSGKAKAVLGIEIVSNAVTNALENAKLNKINNVTFKTGPVEQLIKNIPACYDTWIVDPPRRGLDEITYQAILTHHPHQIIYVSCDPQTLKRDLNLLKESYDFSQITLFDMFSYTYHVECLCILTLK